MTAPFHLVLRRKQRERIRSAEANCTLVAQNRVTKDRKSQKNLRHQKYRYDTNCTLHLHMILTVRYIYI